MAHKMHLLNASTFQLEQFIQNEAPPYAILSHTWGGDEVVFSDMKRGTGKRKASWQKVQHTCQHALRYGLKYAWIDSCCIDKSDEVNLAEELSAMFSYYQQAKICFTFLEDVPRKDTPKRPGSAFEKSRWFTRGWTLQELLAPLEIIFFSRDWFELGRKTSLSDLLSRITGISENILTHRAPIESASIAARMSWAAKRETTRQEDRAYCLLGIFSIYMPKLYGQGDKAFLLLQREILKESTDHSIFAWTDLTASPSATHGLLASSPSHFAGCEDVVAYDNPVPPYRMTNAGLQINLPFACIDETTYMVGLNCPSPIQGNKSGYLVLYLKKLGEKGDIFARISTHTLMEADASYLGPPKTITVPQKFNTSYTEGASSSQPKKPTHSQMLPMPTMRAGVDDSKTKKPFWKLGFGRKMAK